MIGVYSQFLELYLAASSFKETSRCKWSRCAWHTVVLLILNWSTDFCHQHPTRRKPPKTPSVKPTDSREAASFGASRAAAEGIGRSHGLWRWVVEGGGVGGGWGRFSFWVLGPWESVGWFGWFGLGCCLNRSKSLWISFLSCFFGGHEIHVAWLDNGFCWKWGVHQVFSVVLYTNNNFPRALGEILQVFESKSWNPSSPLNPKHLVPVKHSTPKKPRAKPSKTP